MNKASLIKGLWINDWKYNFRILTVLMALEILLAYSPFGYIVLSSISVTTLFIGVLVAALWGGPLSGAAVGLVFGLTSMWKASVTAVNPNDLIFSPVRSGDPMGSVLLALGPRILFGFIAGLVFYVIMKLIPRKTRLRLPVLLVASAVLERVHSMLVYLFMDQVFHVEGASMAKAWRHLFAINRIQTFIVTMLIIAGAYLLFDRFLSKKYYDQFVQTRDITSKINPKYSILMVISIIVIAITAAHLWERIQIVLFEIDQLNPAATSTQLIKQVIFQFMAASAAAIYIIIVLYKHARSIDEMERTKAIVLLDLEKEHAKVVELQATKDPLTGVYNRQGYTRILKELKSDRRPIAVIQLDVDHFKTMNDTYGHAFGDEVLKQLATQLMNTFRAEDYVCRLGGDEFVVLLTNCNLEDWHSISYKQQMIHMRLNQIFKKDIYMTISMGISWSESGFHEKLSHLADAALYKAKSNGRAGCCVFDSKHRAVYQWKDDAGDHVDVDPLVQSNVGGIRIELPDQDASHGRLSCNETARVLMGFEESMTPEECFRTWLQRIDPDSMETIRKTKAVLIEKGQAECTYIYHHPLQGRITVRSGGKCMKHEKGIVCSGYHQSLGSYF